MTIVYCYRHPEIVAVARIQRQILHRTLEGADRLTPRSPVCQQCSDDAQSSGTPLFPLSDELP